VVKEYTDLVTVFVGEEGEADLVRAKLESCGIDACVPTALTARFIFAPNVGPSTVQVRAEDAEAACQALAEVVVLEEGDESGEG
jgi:hypothetical protein